MKTESIYYTPTFFAMGVFETEADAAVFCEAMPPEFREIGHFTVSPKGGGKVEVRWYCHALHRTEVKLPFAFTALAGKRYDG